MPRYVTTGKAAHGGGIQKFGHKIRDDHNLTVVAGCFQIYDIPGNRITVDYIFNALTLVAGILNFHILRIILYCTVVVFWLFCGSDRLRRRTDIRLPRLDRPKKEEH